MERTLCVILKSIQGPLQTTYHIFTMKYSGSTFPSEYPTILEVKYNQTIWSLDSTEKVAWNSSLQSGDSAAWAITSPVYMMDKI